MFSLTVTFQMVSRREVQLHVYRFAEGPEKVGNKFRSAVRCDVRRNTVLGEYVNNKEFCQLSRSNGVEGRNKNGLFCELVYYL